MYNLFKFISRPKYFCKCWIEIIKYFWICISVYELLSAYIDKLPIKYLIKPFTQPQGIGGFAAVNKCYSLSFVVQ